ncbi:MAG: hypothetical protein IJJ33_10400, partial [Victivallales bacterium]|nr:hypothetical protein [Victivallales bacterium]
MEQGQRGIRGEGVLAVSEDGGGCLEPGVRQELVPGAERMHSVPQPMFLGCACESPVKDFLAGPQNGVE